MAIKTQSSTGQGRCPTVVRSGHATGDDGVASLLEGVRQKKLQLANFVAGQGGTGVVVALDEQLDVGTGPVEGLKEPGLDFSHSRNKLLSGIDT